MKFVKYLTTAAMLASMAFAAPASAQEKGLVGVAMPTKSSARWIADGDNMVKVLQERGYETDLQYAEDDVPNQLSQIENMIVKGAKVLVIASIDGTTLSDVLQQAADQGIKVIAYDRLIRDSANVDYYAHVRQLPGGRPAGAVHRRWIEGQRQGRPLAHRALRRLTGR
jgi:putative multiple sugar transport system substrate-binding protein